jgi:hypothetical protein
MADNSIFQIKLLKHSDANLPKSCEKRNSGKKKERNYGENFG